MEDSGMPGGLWVVIFLAGLVLLVISKTARVVPQQSAYVVERLGRYSRTLGAGFHILWPFLDSVQYKHSLKETAIDIPEQICITRDNVQVGVDGILYSKVLDPQRASYGISDYRFAITQLAQTALRSEIGKIELDRTFEERTNINSQVVNELDKATEPWGVKVLRYEIKNITPPKDVLAAMEKQMRAEREKRAVILTSEGERDAAINQAEGEKQQVIKASEAKKQQQINEAEGRGGRDYGHRRAPRPTDCAKSPRPRKSPAATKRCSCASRSSTSPSSGNWPKASNTLVLPANVSDVGSMLALAMNMIGETVLARLAGKVKASCVT
jgi:regulator of protease activity HflC (stomatin/prohibitin superfamily)